MAIQVYRQADTNRNDRHIVPPDPARKVFASRGPACAMAFSPLERRHPRR
jgi:hypothetical protein